YFSKALLVIERFPMSFYFQFTKIFFSCSYSVFSLTFCSYPKVAISKRFTVNQAQTLIEAQSLIQPLNRHFWVGAVIASCSHFVVNVFSPSSISKYCILSNVNGPISL